MNKQIIAEIKKAAASQNIKLIINDDEPETTLKHLGIDSLAAMGIIINVETNLGVRLPDDQLIEIQTIGELVQAFEKQLEKK